MKRAFRGVDRVAVRLAKKVSLADVREPRGVEIHAEADPLGGATGDSTRGMSLAGAKEYMPILL
jgi:hypothetical protein